MMKKSLAKASMPPDAFAAQAVSIRVICRSLDSDPIESFQSSKLLRCKGDGSSESATNTVLQHTKKTNESLFNGWSSFLMTDQVSNAPNEPQAKSIALCDSDTQCGRTLVDS